MAGYADLQFFGLATDASLIASRINEVLPDATAVRPIMRRLDARHFDISEYLLEAQVGAGRLLACTLRLQGGAGGQPWGPRRHVAGAFMLWALISMRNAKGKMQELRLSLRAIRLRQSGTLLSLFVDFCHVRGKNPQIKGVFFSQATFLNAK